MVTTRRRKDHFGGYAMQSGRRISSQDMDLESVSTEREEPYFGIADEPTYDTRVSYGTESRNAFTTTDEPEQQQPIIEYSSLPKYGYMQQPVVAPTRVHKTRKREKEDVMPSIRTRAYAQQQQMVAEEVKPAQRVKLSGKTKVALCVYIASVIVLAALVIATGLAVSNINAKASMLENEIAIKNARVMEQNAQIERLTDIEYVKQVAEGNDMVKVQATTEVDLAPTTDPVHYQGRTNWFDTFCDFLSNIIGG